jgi:serine protease SohB
MEFLSEIGIFLVQAIILVVAILLVVAGIAAISQRRRSVGAEGQIEVRQTNEKYRAFQDAVKESLETPEATKERLKAEKKQAKLDAKTEKKQKGSASSTVKPRLFVLHFEGDIQASATDSLREEISSILPVATAEDEVLVCLESPGGLVHSYGLAASQLQRVTEAGVPLTIAVDKVAASGGYMMACVADKIVAAPFAVIGSIGVLAQIPNFHRLLKKNEIDFELLTAGKYKRTLTVFGENTDEGRRKFVEDLEDTFELFKEFIHERRPQVAIDAVATGEVWFGKRALEKQLVDEIITSDTYIQSTLEERDVVEVRFVPRKSWQEKLGVSAERVIERLGLRAYQRAVERPLP